MLVEYLFLKKKNMYYIRHDDDWDCDKSLYYKILNDFDHIEKSD